MSDIFLLAQKEALKKMAELSPVKPKY